MKTIAELLSKYIIQDQCSLCFFFSLKPQRPLMIWVHYVTIFQHLIHHNLPTLINEQVILSVLPETEADVRT